MLRSLAFRGIPSDIKGLRPIVWKVLIGYLPRETAKWESIMKEQKEVYEGISGDLIVIPNMEEPDLNNPNFINDHPLSVDRKSIWNQYFVDNVVWQEIEKDIRRTRTDMQFFMDAFHEVDRHKRDQIKNQWQSKKADLNQNFKQNYVITHADVMSRILFLYARLNPGVMYV